MIRGLQIVEHACSAASLQMGETMPGVTKDMDTYSVRLDSVQVQCTMYSVHYKLYTVKLYTVLHSFYPPK